DEIGLRRQHHVHGNVNARHHEPAVFIDEIHFYLVRPLLDLAENDPQRDRTLGVHGGQLLSHDGVEGAEQIQLSCVVGRGIAQDGNLDIHKVRNYSTATMHTAFVGEQQKTI